MKRVLLRENSLLLISIVSIGLLIRIFWAQSLPNILSWDEPTYHELASQLASGHGYRFTKGAYETAVGGLPTSFEEPVWPIMLAFAYALFGSGNLLAARIIQAVLGSLLIVVSYGIGLRLADRVLGLVLALFVALYPPFVYFSTLLMSETLYLLLQGIVLLLCLLMLRDGRISTAILLGVTVGLAILTRGIFIAIVPLLAGWLWIALGHSRRATLICSVMLVFAMGTLVPWIVRNWFVHNDLVLVSTKMGYNLYFYNYPLEDTNFFARQVPLPHLDGLTETQRQRVFLRQGEYFLFHNPYWLKFISTKFLEFWDPIPNTFRPLLIGISILSLSSLLLIAILGFIFFLRDKQQPSFNILLYGIVLLYVVIALVFFGGHRARLPVEHLLLLSGVPFLKTISERYRLS